MTFVSHAQNFEDVLLWRALHDVKNGRYVDIGAHDPFIDSVSFAFYEAGWRGVSVEPIPFYAARLREARPDDEVIEAAVDSKPGPIPFYELGGLSSGRKDVADHHERAGHRPRKIFVSTVRLDNLLTLSDDDVHWLKIDVEGMEEQVVKTWGDCPKRPWILIVEATFPNTQKPTQHLWIDEVLRRGYEKVLFDGLSCYFVHKDHQELAARLTAPANVFDAFSITRTHFSAGPMREELDSLNLSLGQERERSREMATTLNQVQLNLDVAAQEQLRALERLTAAESEHRQSLASATEYGRGLEREAVEAQVELARLQERCIQLQDKLNRADQSMNWAEEHARRLESELRLASDAAASTGQQLIEAQRELAELRPRLSSVEGQRDEARAESERIGRESERLIGEQKVMAARVALELSAQIDQFHATLDRAAILIKAANVERSGRWYRIGRKLGFAGRDSAWRALMSWSIEALDLTGRRSIDQQPHPSESKATMNIPASTGARNPYLRANSLEELLSWQDLDFVRCAYVTVLGRQPDAEGERYYTDRLRRSYSKLEILWQLRRSGEAAAHDPGIRGFDRELRRARLRGWPGRVFRRMTGETPPTPSSLSSSEPDIASNSEMPHDSRRDDAIGPDTRAIAAEIESLKHLMDGLGHALRGVTKAQARFDEQLKSLSTTIVPKPHPSNPRNQRKNEVTR